MILDVIQLSKTFELHQISRKVNAFTDLSFQLHPGEMLHVTGPNGVGKSTLLRTLYRTYQATSGKVIYHSLKGSIDLVKAHDVDIQLLRREEIGFVTQFLRPRPRVSALEMVAEPLLSETTPEHAFHEARTLLAEFGLKEELWQAYPTTFSGGEQQKVNLARALIRPRRLLLLDEPTASLDAGAREALRRRLHHLKSQGVAMMAVLHHPEDAHGLIDRALVLSRQEAETDREEELHVAQ